MVGHAKKLQLSSISALCITPPWVVLGGINMLLPVYGITNSKWSTFTFLLTIYLVSKHSGQYFHYM